MGFLFLHKTEIGLCMMLRLIASATNRLTIRISRKATVLPGQNVVAFKVKAVFAQFNAAA